MKIWIKKKVYDYIDFLKDMKNYSFATEKTYNINLLEAVKYIDINEENGTLMIDLMPYRIHIKDKAKKTIYKKVSIFRSFIKYLKNEGEKIKLLNDDNISVQTTLPKPVQDKYIQEAIQNTTLENRLLIELIYGLGLRISELSNLKIKSIKNGWVIIKGKGAKIRQIPLLKRVESVLDIFLEDKKPVEYVFEKDGKKLTTEQLRYRLSKVFKDIGLKVTPHQLRHSFATELLQNGASISDVSFLLGHSSLESTQIYTKLSNSLKMDSYKNSHPLYKNGES